MSRVLIALTADFVLSAASVAFSQSNPSDPSTSTNSSGRGPLNTKSVGGAPASSPQGETPPGMQSAPKGSDKRFGTGPGMMFQKVPRKNNASDQSNAEI